MKKKILIISGGISKERLISLDTGLQVANELKKNGYKVKISEPNNNLKKNISQFKPAVIFNALHGQFGEDGYIQTILESFKIPYTHSGVIASSIAMDKEISKKIFISNKINTPKFIIYSFNKENLNLINEIDRKLKFYNKLKKKILILSGGISKERLISLDTGLQVAKELKKNGYKIKISEPDNNLEKNIKEFKPSVIFNALHGQFGEDGYIQTILEQYQIPYTHSGPIASSIAMDKEISKKIFINNKINTPKFIKYSFDKKKSTKLIEQINDKLKFPVVVKPINEGSSVNVYICTKKNITKILKSMESYKEVMIEEFIAGREIQVAIMGNKKLGAIELKPKRKFYDYDAKYNTNAKTQHIIPVEISRNKLNEVMNMALKAHKVIACRGVSRSDFKFYRNKFYLLEINTQPGMTKLSLVPEIAAYKGISFIKLIEWILKDASTKR